MNLDQPSLAQLACGALNLENTEEAADELKIVLDGVRDSIGVCIASVGDGLRAGGGREQEHVCPVLLRKVLELTFIALQARIDPIRMVSLLRVQSHSDYDHGAPHHAKFSWTGDVFAKNGPPEKAWAPTAFKDGPERAVFGAHVADLVLKPGVEALLVHVRSSESDWLSSLTEVNDVVAQMRGQLNRLYSSLSKGIHAEYLNPNPVRFDTSTLLDHYERVMRWTSIAAASTHFVPMVYRRLPIHDVFDLVRACEQETQRVVDANR